MSDRAEERRRLAREDYVLWRASSDRMDEFWLKRGVDTLDALERIPEGQAVEARRWLTAQFAVCEHGYRMNQRFLLLMLLRTRAMGGI